MSEWISVEDGLPEKKCLATYKNRMGKNRIVVAEYIPRWTVEAGCDDDAPSEYSEEKDEYYYLEGWYEQQDNWGEYASIFINEGEVTHWMPLPKPPGVE
jgi:hypothetical protein